MPTISASSVKVQPVMSSSKMSLSEIRQEMMVRRPDLSAHAGGWASNDDAQSNIGLPNVAPPVSDPEIVQSNGVVPETLRARFYYWKPAPAGLQQQQSNLSQHLVRRLDAIDVILHKPDADHVSILVTSRSAVLTHRKDGAVVSLQKIFQTKDSAVKVDWRSSAFELSSADVFLWLAVRVRDNAQIAPELRLDSVLGISGTDSFDRVADLRSGVDFTRPNFLTAVAESDTLGPIELSFVHTYGSEQRTYSLKLWLDGGFSIYDSGLHFGAVLDLRDKMILATTELAFRLIPRMNELFKQYQAWPQKKFDVIEAAMEELEDRYKGLRAALNSRKPKSRP
ncbi:hypothetical protein [Curtobacterium caseinilyticum]|uniref:Uncharacterized protein n=1 Tax=Curtobacterium caseinilyticum TaxID=3055137 RepID=A0ABT7TP76_9MICO|nr:hypothetical protein [Curtobacterium caseinilyticum]MDM7890687.1 hypothetical protein [Curtobacterium caseinilyticum]